MGPHDKGTDRLLADVAAHGGHSPGPWETDTDTAHGLRTLVFDADGALTANCAHGMSRDDLDAASGECEANARLIASAPDLLAACEDALATIEFMHTEMGPHRCTVDCPDMSKHERTMRAAIAKARGQA